MSKRIDNREFVSTWLHSESVAEVAKTLNRTTATVYQRAVALRRRGVKLPVFARSTSETAQRLEVA